MQKCIVRIDNDRKIYQISTVPETPLEECGRLIGILLKRYYPYRTFRREYVGAFAWKLFEASREVGHAIIRQEFGV